MKEDEILLETPILFLSYKFDYRRGSITVNNGDEIFMENRLNELFSILLNNKNDFVSRNEIINFVWKDIIVSEQSITKAVYDLRKFFNDHKMNTLNIILNRKLGYKLEIEEPENIERKQISFFKLLPKILIYTIFSLIIIIILIRAMRYQN